MLILEAPAKINLTLEVLGKRTDGYHEIRSVMQAISLIDTLYFEPAAEVSFCCDNPAWEAQRSLVFRAAEMLAKQAASLCGAAINIKKRIPLASGLGGDSSDAAAVMRGLNRLWNLGIPPGDIVTMSSTLGSDVPFFFSGGTALSVGRGEIISPLPDMLKSAVVLLMPEVSRPASKTAGMYFRLRPEHFTGGGITDSIIIRLTRGEPLASCNLYNVFDAVADAAYTGMRPVRDDFQNIAGRPVHLAGAGPTLYALFSDRREASRVCDVLRDKGYQTCLAETQNSVDL